MKYQKLEHYLSQPRLNRFLNATGNSKHKAQKLYRINLRVAQSFYPLLNISEIFLRNTINYQIVSHFNDPNWIVTQKNGFMNNNSLRGTNFFLKNSVIKTERMLRRKRSIITAGKIISEQPFGFWTSLFDKHHYRLIRGCIIKGFSNKPSYINRNRLNQKLNKIREFRNRIYHNEPICFNGGSINFSNCILIKNDIYDILEWIDVDLKIYVEYFDNIDAKINSANNL